MVRRGIALIWVVSTLLVALAGCHHDAAATRDTPQAGGPLLVVAALPLKASLAASTAKARLEVARTPGIAHKLDTGHPDVVVADSVTIDRLIAAGKLDAATRRALVVDRLVVIAQPGSPVPLTKPADLARIGAGVPPWRGRLAVLDPDSWPEGALTRSTLQAMRVDDHPVWETIGARVQPVAGVDELVRAVEEHKRMLGVLGHAAAVPLGDRVHALVDLGPAVAYQAAVATAAPHRDAAVRFIGELASDAGLRAFEQRGFQRGK